jgi:hypothetical protein
MNNTNNIIVKLGRQNTVRIFEAVSGRLMREIAVNGTICDNPVQEGADVSVEFISEGRKYRDVYNPRTGSLKSRDIV